MLGSLLYLALGCSLLGYLLLNYAFRFIPASRLSVFVNTMQDLDDTWDNKRFISDLIENGEYPIVIDQMNSRTSDTEGMSTMLHVLRTTLSIEIIVVVLLMLSAAVAWRRKLL